MGFDKLIYGWTALFPIAVLLYYFFRKRYEVKTISSTLFWEQSMRETKVSPYLKNLQRNALFYLQMAALLLLLFVLLNPYIKTVEISTRQTIIVVDTSASMLASQDGVFLFDKHKIAMKELSEERAGQPITIITTGKEPTTIIRDEMNIDAVNDAIENLEVTYEHEFIENAIEFTRSIAAESGADIHIYTDSLDRLLLPVENDFLAWTINSSEADYDNVSVDKFGALKTADGTQAIVKLQNYSKVDKEGDVLLTEAITGAILAQEKFNIEGEDELLLSFQKLKEVAALSVEIIIEDDYELDNEAHILLGNETATAIVDQQLHELVKKAFEAIGLAVSTGSQYELASASEETLIVTNDVSLLTKGAGPIILLGRNDHTAEEVSGVVETVMDPLFSIVDMSSVYVSELYPAFDEFKTIATVGGRPFIQTSNRGDIIILSDVEMTDWPLHPSFPLFMWSAVEMHGTDGDSLGIFIPNERKSVIFGGPTDQIEIYTIEDKYVTTISGSSSFIAPNRPGVYQARDGEVEKMFVVELESAEKVFEKGKSFHSGKITNEEGTELSKRMFGPLLILPILLIMLLEWEVQRRRGYPN